MIFQIGILWQVCKLSLGSQCNDFSYQSFIVFVFAILQGGEALEVGVIKKLKRYKTSSTKPHQHRHPDPRPRAVLQPAIMDVVLETTARLTQAATVMWSATTFTTAVTTLCLLAATVSMLPNRIVVSYVIHSWGYEMLKYYEKWLGIWCLSTPLWKKS